MRRLYIIGEGQTEEEFVNKIIQPYLLKFSIYAVCILISTSKKQKGGDLKFQRYKKRVGELLQDKEGFVTSLIDFYALHNDFPKYEKAQKIIDKQERVDFLEEAIGERIKNSRLIPYIQLHEFEGLLFSDITGFQQLEPLIDIDIETLKKVIEQFPNPELINDGKETHPSERLDKATNKQYGKVAHLNKVATAIGIETIREKCPRFNAWLENIIKKMNAT